MPILIILIIDLIWLGDDHARKLYLVNEQKFKVGAAVNKYFSLRTNWELLD